MLVAEQRFAGDVETDHGEWYAGVEDDSRSLGIDIEVELRRRRDVSAGKRSTHDGDRFYHARDLGIGAQSSCHIGKWPDCNDSDLTWVLANDATNDLAGSFSNRFCFWWRQLSAAESVLTVDIGSSNQSSSQRNTRAGGYRTLGAGSEFEQCESVWEGVFKRNVAGHRRDRFDLEFRRAQGKKDRHGVIGARIGIEDDANWFGGNSELRHAGGDQRGSGSGDEFAAVHGPQLSVCFCDEDDSPKVEHEHQHQKHFGLRVRAFEFLPGEYTPERGDHWGGLADRV